MQSTNRSTDRRQTLAVVVIAALLVAALVPLAARRGNAQEVPATTDLDASTPVQAAVEFSKVAFPNGSVSAFIGRDDVFADLLSSGGPQGLSNAPLLLTDTDTLSPETRTELDRLGATSVTILGGNSAVSTEVETALRDSGLTVTRISGATRLETATEVARALFPSSTTAVLARAFSAGSDATQAFADSLAAGGLAADEQIPVLLTETDQLSTSTASYLSSSSITTVIIVGGTAAVGQAVEDALIAQGITVVRLSGQDRFETATEIAQRRGFMDSTTATSIILVEGQSPTAYADGFPAAALAAARTAPIVLANGQQLPPATQAFLEGATPNVVRISSLVCGPFVSDSACAAAETALGGSAASPSPSSSSSATPLPTASLPPCVDSPITVVTIPGVTCSSTTTTTLPGGVTIPTTTIPATTIPATTIPATTIPTTTTLTVP